MRKNLKYFYGKVFLVALWYISGTSMIFADGSRNLYPETATGGRAFLYSNTYTGSSGSTMASWPFKTLGTHYAYVVAGEIIHAASSAQGIGNGRIILTAPDGTVYTSSNNITGQIASRTAELAGPLLSGQGNGASRYSTFNRTANSNQTGIWKVDFTPTGDVNSTSTPTITNIAATGAWSQSNNSELTAAWDVSVESSGSWSSGRVYTNVINLHISSSQTAGFYGQFYALTKDGYIYRVNNNGNNGVGFTFFVNNKGFISGEDSRYKSMNFSSGIASSVHSPLSTDTSQQITHKIFYSMPATALPETATGSVPGGETWLRKEVTSPTVVNVSLVGAENTPQQVSSVKGGFVKFNAAVQGLYTVTIESTATPATFTSRILTGSANIGDNSIFWDGKDGNLVNLPPGNQPIRIKVQLRGAEVHFPFIDMEINPRGMVLELLNGSDTSNERFRVYWDDSDITRTSTNNEGKAPDPLNASINGSLSGPSGTGGHMWGQQNNNTDPLGSTTLGSGFGNEKSIDTWSYIKGPEAQYNTAVLIKVADLQVASLMSDRSIVRVGEDLTYTIKVKNNGPSSVTGSTFKLLLPPGFDHRSYTFSANNCGSEPSPLAYSIIDHSYTSLLDLPNGCEITYRIIVTPSSIANDGNISAVASILRPNDVTDPDATNTVPGMLPTNAEYECANNGIDGNCNNIVTNSATAYSSEEICTEPVNGNAFKWSFASSSDPSITQNITQPASNYGFVFDIYELDNSFNLDINGTLIAAQELQFQSNGTSGINVAFEDGAQYEVNTTHDGTTADIWQMRGNSSNPLIRIIISPTGHISLFGSKSSYGPLFPLVLQNGNMLNSIVWNQAGANNITVTQNVVGVTIMDGYGYGLNTTPCACYKPAVITGNGQDTRVGITLLHRAGINAQGNWPMVRKSGHLALESNTRGFVITRHTTLEIEGQNSPSVIAPKIISPQEGMMVYDTTAKCLKIFHDGIWSCFNKPACP